MAEAGRREGVGEGKLSLAKTWVKGPKANVTGRKTFWLLGIILMSQLAGYEAAHVN